MDNQLHGEPSQLGELFGALAKAQQEIDPAKKRASNPHFKSKYADLATVFDAILPALNNHNMSLLQLVGKTEDGCVTLTTILGHQNGAYILSTASCPFGRGGGPQGAGSGLTYLRRYAAQALVGLGAEDDDGNDAQKVKAVAKPKAKPKPKATPKPKAPGAHDPSFNNKTFAQTLSNIGDGWSYDQVAWMCEQKTKLRPSKMEQAERNGLVRHLTEMTPEKSEEWRLLHDEYLQVKKEETNAT
mgnify:FL=1